MTKATLLVNESAGFAPTRKFHIATAFDVPALCGAEAAKSAGHWNVSVSDRAEFERLLPERICLKCRKIEEAS